MKRGLYLGWVIALTLLLCACMDIPGGGGTTTVPSSEAAAAVPSTAPSTEPATQPSAAPVTTAPVVEIPELTKPAHSQLYLPAYTFEQVWENFEEIVLHMEYSDGVGDSSLVQKWNTPMRYRVYGDPTQEDLEVLAVLFGQLNELEGFPGVQIAADWETENLALYFVDPESFSAIFSEIINGEDAYGAVQFWYYTDTNDIYTANVGYRTDIDQTTRNSILLEEIVNALGVSDTVLREDSIVYQYSNDNLALSDMDWLILKLLYNPAIQCGMDWERCRAVIGELYF